MNVRAVTFLDRVGKIEIAGFRKKHYTGSEDKRSSQRERPKRFDPATARWRDLRFDFFPKRAGHLAVPHKSAEALVEFFLCLKQTSALRTRFEMLLDFKALFSAQLRIEIESDEFSDFGAFHNHDRFLARKIASRIFCRARERFPITLPSGIPRHSLISR